MKRHLCLEVVNGLEAIKQCKLQNTKIVSVLGDLMFRYQIRDTRYLNDLVESVLAYEAGNRGTDGKQPPISLTPDVLVTSDYLAEKITPWVEIIRTELFGSASIPFGNLKDAEDWILAHGGNRQLSSAKSLDDPSTLRDLVYVGPDGVYRVAHIVEPAPPTWLYTHLRGRASDYSPVNWLENEIRLMSEATLFYQPVLVQFILMGTPPILLRYDITGVWYRRPIPSRPGQRQRRGLGDESLRVSYVDARIYAQDLTFVELRELYNEYREILQIKKHKLREGKNLSISHWELYQLIKGKGGPPKERGKVAFWESAKSEWNKLHRQHKYQTWKGVKIAYDRLIKQLEHRSTG